MEVNVLRRVSAAAQEVAVLVVGAEVASRLVLAGPSMQNSALLLTQKTSRQQAVTPRLGGRLLKVAGAWEVAIERIVERGEGAGWDCSRTRTTSRGVTRTISQ